MTFDEYEVKLLELYEKRFDEAYTQNDDYKTVIVEFNEVFLNLVKSSITEQKFFSGSPLDIFILELNRRLKINQKDEIDFDENEFLKTLYLFLNKIFSSNRYDVKENSYYFIPTLDDKNYNLFRSIIRKRINYLEKLLFKKGIEVVVSYPNGDTSRIVRDFKKNINIMVEYDNFQPIKATPKPKTNKSLMFEGNNLNIKDRYRILNKVLDFDKKVHPLNIGELEKYQLLAYILGIDKDNARKLMNGSHDAKDNDLTTYFNDLGLNK